MFFSKLPIESRIEEVPNLLEKEAQRALQAGGWELSGFWGLRVEGLGHRRPMLGMLGLGFRVYRV